MNYAQYVSRRPPSPPSPHHRYRPFAPSASLSSAASTVSSETPLGPSPSSRPPFHTAEAVSTQLHRRAVRDEYASLAAIVLANVQLDHQRERHEIIRIRLEDMIASSDSSNHRVLTLALSKCTARLDSIAQQSHHLEHARSRMRVIEAKHFHGTSAPSVEPRLRALHIRREHIATLVDHIRCTLHDQVRIHLLLTNLAAKLSALYALVTHMNRGATHNTSEQSDRPAAYVPSRAPRVSSFTHENARRSSAARRVSINPFANSSAEQPKSANNIWLRADRTPARADRSNTRSDRQINRGRTLPTQRSLPQRGGENRRLPFVVKRALSYNASSIQNISTTPSEPLGVNRSNSVHERTAAQSEPRLRLSDTFKRNRKLSASTKSSGSFGDTDADPTSEQRTKSMRGVDHNFRDTDRQSGSPVSPHMRAFDKCSLEESVAHYGGDDPQLEQAVLLDIDSLCTEASSVLSSSRSTHKEMFEKRSSSSLFGSNEGKRGLGFSRLGFHRVRTWSQIRKLWAEVNEMYGMVITHGPHLLEEKIVSTSSVEHGVLGEWISPRKGRTSGMKGTVHKTIVAEAVRKVEDVVSWQQKLIVAIRRDSLEQKRSLLQADMVISEAYLQSLQSQPLSK